MWAGEVRTPSRRACRPYSACERKSCNKTAAAWGSRSFAGEPLWGVYWVGCVSACADEWTLCILAASALNLSRVAWPQDGDPPPQPPPGLLRSYSEEEKRNYFLHGQPPRQPRRHRSCRTAGQSVRLPKSLGNLNLFHEVEKKKRLDAKRGKWQTYHIRTVKT